MSEAKIPTQEEIAQLPLWVRVAFVARCARRVLPLFVHGWPDAPAEHVAAVVRAVEIAEQCAADRNAAVYGSPAAFAGSAGASAHTAAAAAETAAINAVNAGADAVGFRTSAYAAHAAADAADAAQSAYNRGDCDVGAAYAAAAAAAYRRVTVAAIVEDFQLLHDRARSEGWNRYTHLPPSDFGPLWPDGPPAGWPTEDPSRPAQEPSRSQPFDPISPPAIVIAWDPTVVTPAQYAILVAALDKVVKAHGGAGLKRLEGKPFATPAPVEVPTR